MAVIPAKPHRALVSVPGAVLNTTYPSLTQFSPALWDGIITPFSEGETGGAGRRGPPQPSAGPGAGLWSLG